MEHTTCAESTVGVGYQGIFRTLVNNELTFDKRVQDFFTNLWHRIIVKKTNFTIGTRVATIVGTLFNIDNRAIQDVFTKLTTDTRLFQFVRQPYL